MADQTVCPRCGARASFIRGYLPETCVCRVCQSQLDWREIPGCAPACSAKHDDAEQAGGEAAAGEAAETTGSGAHAAPGDS